MGFPAHSVVQTGYTTPTLRFSGYTKPPCGCNVTYIYYTCIYIDTYAFIHNTIYAGLIKKKVPVGHHAATYQWD